MSQFPESGAGKLASDLPRRLGALLTSSHGSHGSHRDISLADLAVGSSNQNVIGAGLWLATVRSSLDDQVDWNQQRDAVSNLFLLGEAVAHLATAKMEARRR